MTNIYDQLQQQLAYSFKDIAVCQQALTHRSFSSQHNERLEFLGDALLDVIVGEYLYKHFPDVSEGELSLMRSQAVCGESLAVIGRKLSLGQLLRLGDGEVKSGGRDRQSSLANAIESLIAAVYLDSGDFKRCEQMVLALFAEVLALSSPVRAKDAKTELQERMQARHLTLPHYELIQREGKDHNAIFTIRCALSDLNLAAEASAGSRKKAEQLSAQAVLALLEKSV